MSIKYVCYHIFTQVKVSMQIGIFNRRLQLFLSSVSELFIARHTTLWKTFQLF